MASKAERERAEKLAAAEALEGATTAAAYGLCVDQLGAALVGFGPGVDWKEYSGGKDKPRVWKLVAPVRCKGVVTYPGWGKLPCKHTVDPLFGASCMEPEGCVGEMHDRPPPPLSELVWPVPLFTGVRWVNGRQVIKPRG